MLPFGKYFAIPPLPHLKQQRQPQRRRRRQRQQQKLYLHDHKGITTLQKLQV